MQSDPPIPIGERLRQSMRCWVTGVTVVTSRFEDAAHGMTANSFGSISLEPPLVTITMNNDTRTFAMVRRSGVFAVTVLSISQQHLAELFAGRVPDAGNRLAGLDTFVMVTGAPLLAGGLAFVDCRVVHEYPMARSTLLIGEVVAAQTLPASEPILPLIYYNRTFHKLEE
jgi:flavin reductase (DIM6/NTAB) family NADH-FMN oxidoreductase RutF